VVGAAAAMRATGGESGGGRAAAGGELQGLKMCLSKKTQSTFCVPDYKEWTTLKLLVNFLNTDASCSLFTSAGKPDPFFFLGVADSLKKSWISINIKSSLLQTMVMHK
jgi:hypothetical protein